MGSKGSHRRGHSSAPPHARGDKGKDVQHQSFAAALSSTPQPQQQQPQPQQQQAPSFLQNLPPQSNSQHAFDFHRRQESSTMGLAGLTINPPVRIFTPALNYLKSMHESKEPLKKLQSEDQWPQWKSWFTDYIRRHNLADWLDLTKAVS